MGISSLDCQAKVLVCLVERLTRLAAQRQSGGNMPSAITQIRGNVNQMRACRPSRTVPHWVVLINLRSEPLAKIDRLANDGVDVHVVISKLIDVLVAGRY